MDGPDSEVCEMAWPAEGSATTASAIKAKTSGRRARHGVLLMDFLGLFESTESLHQRSAQVHGAGSLQRLCSRYMCAPACGRATSPGSGNPSTSRLSRRA